MTYILLIILTLDANQNSKDIELRIPYENEEECFGRDRRGSARLSTRTSPSFCIYSIRTYESAIYYGK